MNSVSSGIGVPADLQPRASEETPEENRGKTTATPKKKLRLLSKSLRPKKESDDSSSNEADSPFPGIPLHTVHKMPEKGNSRSGDTHTRSISISSSSSSSSAKDESSSEEKGCLPKGESSTEFNLVKSGRMSESEMETESEIDTEGERESDVEANDERRRTRTRTTERPQREESQHNDQQQLQLQQGEDEEHNQHGGDDDDTTKMNDDNKGKEVVVAGEQQQQQQLEPQLKNKKNKKKKKKNNVIKILHEYANHPIPKPSQTMTFFIYKGLSTIKFHRPAFHDQEVRTPPPLPLHTLYTLHSWL